MVADEEFGESAALPRSASAPVTCYNLRFISSGRVVAGKGVMQW